MKTKIDVLKRHLAQECKLESKYEAIIVGAGPAGLSVAKVLSEAGRKVLVLEKNDERGEKVCAGGITPKDIYLGIPEELISKHFKSVTLYTENKEFTYAGNKTILSTISREDLSWWQQSNDLHPDLSMSTGKEVTRVEKDHVIVNGEQKIEYDVLIGADGSNSIVRKYLEIPTTKILMAMQYLVPKSLDNLELYFNAKKYGITYLWIFPHKKYTSIGTGVDLFFKKNSSEVKERLGEFVIEKGFNLNECTFQSCPINYDYQGFAFGNIFLVGDAAGVASGATGEGIYSAIMSGREVGEYIIDRDYGFPLLQDWLDKKQKQEKNLRSCQKMESFADTFADTVLPMFKYPFIQKYIVNLTGL